MNHKLLTTALVCAFASSQGFGAEISAGAAASYARLADGTVKAWGLNGQYARLGISNDVAHSVFYTPTNVLKLSDGSILGNVAAVAGGREYALALLTDGTAVGWGENASGQLGTGNYQQKIAAAPAFTTLSNVVQVGAGWTFSLALLSNGDVYGTGGNSFGQIGSAVSTVKTNVPHQVVGLSNIVKIATGTKHALAIRSDGTLWSWGEGDSGKLGDGQTINRTNPVQVANLSNVVGISAAVYHSLAITDDGQVWAWGGGTGGRLGTGNQTSQHTPVLVTNSSYTDVVITVTTNIGTGSVVIGNCLQESTSITLITNYCTNTFSLQGNVIAVAAGMENSYALTQDGRVWAWGKNDVGQLGIGGPTTGESLVPVPVKDPSGNGYLANVVAIAASKHATGDAYSHCMALLSDGRVVTWGDNVKGQLGLDPAVTLESSLPVVAIQP